MPFDDIVYGDPAKTLEDTIEQPRAKIITDNLKDEYIINIPKGKFEIDFIIKNIGKLDVTYSFDKSDIIEISPISGIIPINNETKIHLKALEHLNINAQSSEEINNNLKPKSAKIYFKSNAGDKELTVKY
jgi:hypothetical protein